MKKLIFFLTCTLLSNALLAQEKIFLKSQAEPINATVTEINSSEVKYKPEDAQQLIIGVPLSEVQKIVFKSGRVHVINDPLKDFILYKNQKQWSAKIGLLSPAAGFTDLYLEKSLKPGRSVEFQATIIGLGKNVEVDDFFGANTNGTSKTYFNQKGFNVGVGLKVLKKPDFDMGYRQLTHILQGSYLKPSIVLGFYQRDFYYIDPIYYTPMSKKANIINGSFNVNLGHQWVLDNIFSIDIYAMVGIGVDNYRKEEARVNKEFNSIYNNGPQVNNMPFRNFGYTRFGSGDIGLALGAGLKIGYLFNLKKQRDSFGLNKMRERLNK